MVSDAQKRAAAKYLATQCDRVEIRIEHGGKELLKRVANDHTKSLNAYLLDILRRGLEDDFVPPETIAAICGDGSGGGR